MTHAARVLVDPLEIPPTDALRSLVDCAPLVVISGRAMADLAEELGGYEAAARHLADLSNETGRPLAVNVPLPDGQSRTCFVAPASWTQEKLRGFIGGHHELLEREFGDISRVYPLDGRPPIVRPNRAQRRRRQRERSR
jgi:hypothetical protein